MRLWPGTFQVFPVLLGVSRVYRMHIFSVYFSPANLFLTVVARGAVGTQSGTGKVKGEIHFSSLYFQ